MSISGVFAISIFDRSDADPANWVVVQKNRIASVGTFYADGLVDGNDSKGQEMYAGDESMLEFECYDTDGDDQLRTWEGEDKEVEFVIAGLQQNVLCYEPMTIQVLKPKGFGTGGRNRTRIRLTKKGGGTHKIWSGINLLDGAVKVQGFATGWQDSNADDLADGYTALVAPVLDFSDGLQTVDSGGSDRGIRLRFLFPVSGIALTFSLNQTDGRKNGSLMSLIASDHSNSVLATDSQSYTELQIGIKSAKVTAPTGTFHLEAKMVCEGPTTFGDNSEFVVKDLSMRTDGSSEYVNY